MAKMGFFKASFILMVLVFIATGCGNYAAVGTDAKQAVAEKKTVVEEKAQETIALEEPQKESKQEILAENVKSQSSSGQENDAPSIAITEPDSGDVISSSPSELWWSASDPNNDKLVVKLEYQKGGNWVLIEDNILNQGSYDSFQWNLGNLGNGDYQLRATVSDGRKEASSTKSFSINR